MFHNEVKKILPTINEILKKIETNVSIKVPLSETIPTFVDNIKFIIDTIRHSLVPEELKEEMYLHFISWRKGRYGNNTQILQLLPAFTMYLKPPLQIQKYLVAAILQNDNLNLNDLPLCLATNPNEPTSDNIYQLQSEFVERDWIPTDKLYCQLFWKKGEVTFDVQLLDKQTLTVTVPESKTIAELMSVLADNVQMTVQDREHFWLYKFSRQTQQIVPYQSREHVGEMLADFDVKQSLLLLKRRLYCRELKYFFVYLGTISVNTVRT